MSIQVSAASTAVVASRCLDPTQVREQKVVSAVLHASLKRFGPTHLIRVRQYVGNFKVLIWNRSTGLCTIYSLVHTYYIFFFFLRSLHLPFLVLTLSQLYFHFLQNERSSAMRLFTVRIPDGNGIEYSSLLIVITINLALSQSRSYGVQGLLMRDKRGLGFRKCLIIIHRFFLKILS